MKLQKSCVLVLGLLLGAGLIGCADKPEPAVDEEKPVAGQPQPVGEAKQPAEAAHHPKWTGWPKDAPPPAIAPFDAATAKKHQQAWADYLGLPIERGIDLPGGEKLTFVLIPAGSFMMGDADGESCDKPVHQVRITKPFYLGKYEVTQEQWQAIMGTNPSDFKGAKNPVENVNWNDCHAFLTKLNEKVANTGKKFVLPTEAQWEYACRAGTTTQYSYGDSAEELGDYAWSRSNAGRTTHPVGQKKPNAWGLYDMHGNVSFTN